MYWCVETIDRMREKADIVHDNLHDKKYPVDDRTGDAPHDTCQEVTL